MELIKKEALLTKIQKNFDSMMATLECIIDPFNPIKSMIVTGASGIGKTYNLEKRLDQAHANGDCNFSVINSKCTALGLYKALYNSRNLCSVLLLDDVDVFSSEDTLNILKAALDTGNKRYITYQSCSTELRSAGIPNEFEFKGKVIFITNRDLNKMRLGNSNLVPHINALLSRAVFIDLEIHDNESIMVHIENVIKSTDILSNLGLNKTAQNAVLEFLMVNYDSLINPSLRTPVQLSGLYLRYPDTWTTLAEKAFLV